MLAYLPINSSAWVAVRELPRRVQRSSFTETGLARTISRKLTSRQFTRRVIANVLYTCVGRRFVHRDFGVHDASWHGRRFMQPAASSRHHAYVHTQTERETWGDGWAPMMRLQQLRACTVQCAATYSDDHVYDDSVMMSVNLTLILWSSLCIYVTHCTYYC